MYKDRQAIIMGKRTPCVKYLSTQPFGYVLFNSNIRLFIIYLLLTKSENIEKISSGKNMLCQFQLRFSINYCPIYFTPILRNITHTPQVLFPRYKHAKKHNKSVKTILITSPQLNHLKPLVLIAKQQTHNKDNTL